MSKIILFSFLWAFVSQIGGVPARQESAKTPYVHELLQKYPKLVAIGTYNSRTYFFEDTLVNQYQARASCKAMGMELARFEGQEALTYIGKRLEGYADYVWTDAHSQTGNTYVWENSVEIPTDLLLTDGGSVGLVVDRYTVSKLRHILRLTLTTDSFVIFKINKFHGMEITVVQRFCKRF